MIGPARRLARRARAALPRRQPRDVHAPVVAAFARAHPDAVFVQIGAHDGQQLDPLRAAVLEQRWSGVMVEPVPYVFDRLVTHYGHLGRVALENSAVAETDGSRPLHYLPESADAGLPPWYDALASFRRDVLEKHAAFIPDIESRIRTVEVPCLTFETLCAKHGLDAVDLVQIDTEGFDFEIIKTIDLDRYAPLVLIYEDLHLDTATREACRAHLARYGYESVANGMDVLCLRMPALSGREAEVVRAFRRARRRQPV